MTADDMAPLERLLFGCYICRPDNPNASEEGCAECDERASLARRADHFQFAYEEASAGRCWASGMSLPECRRSICDCFDFPWIKTVAPKGRPMTDLWFHIRFYLSCLRPSAWRRDPA